MDSRDAACEAAYQGRPGAYSEAAARRLCGPAATLLPCHSLADVIRAVVEGRARSGVMAVENTLTGSVPGTAGLLLSSGLVVCGETTEAIDHVLAAPRGATLSGLTEILSHPVALAQCVSFLSQRPAVKAVPAFNTAGALEMLMADRRTDRAAIVSRTAAALYGATVLADHIQDHAENYTRFLWLAPHVRSPSATKPCRIIMAVRLPHRTGALAALMRSIALLRVNITRVDSAPVRGLPFEYEFLLEGIAESQASAGALIDAVEPAGKARLLGCYG